MGTRFIIKSIHQLFASSSLDLNLSKLTCSSTERIELINVERTTQELRPTKRNSLSPSLKVAARVYLDEKLGAEQVLYFSVTDNL